MPEGHSLRRLAIAFDAGFVGSRCELWSPQGRFVDGAAMLDGLWMTGATSVGKHLFLRFDPSRTPVASAVGDGVLLPAAEGGLVDARPVATRSVTTRPMATRPVGTRSSNSRPVDNSQLGVSVEEQNLLSDAALSSPERAASVSDSLWLHVHLGLYGAWRFYGEGGARGTSETPVVLETFIGAPRVGVHTSEIPPPRGAVRVRIETANRAADLNGPTRCEVLTAEGVQAILDRLGPDPLDLETDPAALRKQFVELVRSSGRTVGELVMDQSVAAGVGNIYRAEALFRQGISPFRKGNNVAPKRLERLWDDFVELLDVGVKTGRIKTIRDADIVEDDLDPEASRWYVYKRTGRACLHCGNPVKTRKVAGRNLFWCGTCQR